MGRTGIVSGPGRAEWSRMMRAGVAGGASARERARFAREAESGRARHLADMDRLIELAGAKRAGGGRSPVLAARVGRDGRPAPPGCAWLPHLLSDDTILRLGGRCMERLRGGDRGRAGDGTELWESLLLTEAAMSLAIEAEARGLMPHEQAWAIRREAERVCGLVRETAASPPAADPAAERLVVHAYGPLRPGDPRPGG